MKTVVFFLLPVMIVFETSFFSRAQTITTLAGNGLFGSTGDGGPARLAKLGSPSGVAADRSGNIYIADQGGQRVRKVNAAGIISTVAGNGGVGFSADSVAATTSELNYPEGVAVDKIGNVYIADQYNQRIRKVDTSGIITTIGGSGAIGYSGDDGPATGAALYNPADVGVDNIGNVYFVDQDNHAVRKISASGVITTIAGTGSGGYGGDGGPATAAELYFPQGIAVDSAGNIFVADLYNERVRKIDVLTGIITLVAGNGTGGFSGDGGPATAAGIAEASAVAVDRFGNLFIADLYNERIRKVDAVTGVIQTVAGGGTITPDSCGPATSALLNAPQGIAVDTNDYFYIADFNHSVVRKVWDTVCAASEGIGTDNASAVVIFPNPSDGIFTIKNCDTQNPTDINVYNLLGNAVYQKRIIYPSIDIDFSGMPSGVYTINIRSINNTGVWKLIIDH